MKLPPETAALFRLCADAPVLIGLSGGVDSIVLAHFLRTTPPWNTLEQHAIYVHHHLRESAENDCRCVTDFCAEMGLPLTIAHCHPQAESAAESLETCCRRLRYAAFEQTARDCGASSLFLAHHADDRIETFFQRFMRGSNASGLIAPRAFSRSGTLRIFRLLLHVPKSELYAYAEKHRLPFAEDETNFQTTTLRNVLRNTVLPELFRRYTYAHGGMLASLHALESDAAFIEHAAEEAYLRCQDEASGALKRAEFAALHPALQIRVLRRLLNTVPGASFFARVRESAAHAETRPREIPLNRTCGVRIDKKFIHPIHND